MINFWILVPVFVGGLVILQSVLNKNFGEQFGLSLAVTINATVFLVLSLGLLALSFKFEFIPEFLKLKMHQYQFSWVHIVPGLCGFLLVLLIPWSILHLGAGLVYILLVASQLLLSALWDTLFHNTPLTPAKVISILLTVIAFFVYNSKS